MGLTAAGTGYQPANMAHQSTFQSTWWYPNYIEYASGLNPPKTWPQVMEQYRRPNIQHDHRYYDLPTEEYAAKLYYNMPRLGIPKYRGLFRDKPHTVPSYYPGDYPGGKPIGFHGRVYYEDGPPQFKYDGPKLDKLYWLERPPYTPSVGKTSGNMGAGHGTQTGLCSNPASYRPDTSVHQGRCDLPPPSERRGELLSPTSDRLLSSRTSVGRSSYKMADNA